MRADGGPPAADGCRYVFLDVGGNIGVHARFLFEPELYRHSSYLPIFDRAFPANRDRSDICVFGFEPNRRHRTRLDRLAAAYSKHRGWNVSYLSVAAGTEDGRAHYFRDSDENAVAHNDWTFRRHSVNNPAAGSIESIKTLDLANWVHANVHRRTVPEARLRDDPLPAVVMKMDIEGAEYDVLPRLLATGVLCNVSVITLEWHRRYCTMNKDCTQLEADLTSQLERTTRMAGCAIRVV